MGHIRAQITTRSGPPGTTDVRPIAHGDFTLSGGQAPREFMGQLRACLEAARVTAGDGMVTEVAVLVFPELAGGRNGTERLNGR